MNTWRTAGVADAAKLLKSRKLAALAAAWTAGVRIPDGRVLLRIPQRDGSSCAASEISTCDEWLAALARDDGEVLIRASHAPASPTWRAIVAKKADVISVLELLLTRFPAADAVLVQERWHAADASRRVVSIDTNLANPSPRDAYQVRGFVDVDAFVETEADASRIRDVCTRLALAFGARAKLHLGVGASEITFLSAHASDVEVDDLAETTLDLALSTPSLRPAAVAVFTDIERDRASAFAFAQGAGEVICQGRSVGALWASGRVAFGSEAQQRMTALGDPVVMVREILRADDCDLFRGTDGIVSLRDGVSSHFALLAGSLRKACLVDLPDMAFEGGAMRTPAGVLSEGDWITIDERSGLLRRGRAVAAGQSGGLPGVVLEWANTQRRTGLFVNCEQPEEVRSAIEQGADGVGLCRSERHLLASRDGRDALRSVVGAGAGLERSGAIERVCGVLGKGLEELLVAAAGKPVSYRLLEPAELLSDHDAEEQTVPTSPAWMLRGKAFRTRFPDLVYAQIDHAVRAAAYVAARSEFCVNLALIVPMVAEVEEYALWARHARDQAAAVEQGGVLNMRLKVGAMVETPRAALIAGDLAADADVLLFGTNDLTALVWGAERFAASGLGGDNRKDPFEEFDEAGVGSLMLQASTAAKARNAEVQITVCGGHASNAEDCLKLLATGIDGLSCHIHAVPEMALSLASAAETTNPPVGIAPSSSAQAVFRQTLQTAMREIVGSGCASALQQWSQEIAAQLGFERSDVWKFFKRDLTSAWFGAREARRFLPGWSVDAACAYALELTPRYAGLIRFSVFPADIACRAFSELLPSPGGEAIFRRALSNLDQEVAIEVFPQQPPERISFRAVLKGRILSVEGALGPAIDVFWKAPRALTKFCFSPSEGFFDRNDDNEQFIKLFERGVGQLYARASSMRDYLGADWISLEGYAGPSPDSALFIADLDLPLDSVFLVNRTAT